MKSHTVRLTFGDNVIDLDLDLNTEQLADIQSFGRYCNAKGKDASPRVYVSCNDSVLEQIRKRYWEEEEFFKDKAEEGEEPRDCKPIVIHHNKDHIRFQFCGWGVVLNEDGTYWYDIDTTGG